MDGSGLGMGFGEYWSECVDTHAWARVCIGGSCGGDD